jgi:hypothetical protein
VFAERIFLFCNIWAALSQIGVQGSEAFPFFGNIVVEEDGVDRALGNARFTVDTLIRVDVERSFAFVKTFDGANRYAVSVFTVETRVANNVCHEWRLRLLFLLGFL